MKKIEQLTELGQLLKDKVITQQEFDGLKEEILKSSDENVKILNSEDIQMENHAKELSAIRKEKSEKGPDYYDDAPTIDEIANRPKISQQSNKNMSDVVDDLITELTGRAAGDKRLERLLGRKLSI